MTTFWNAFQPGIYRRAVLMAAMLVVAFNVQECAAQYDNGNPMFSVVYGDVLSDDLAPLRIADDFILPASAPQISSFMWFGWDGPSTSTPPLRKFTIEIYESGVVGPIGSPIYVFRDITPVRSYIMSGGAPRLTFSWPLFRYQYNISPITLNPDKLYWISIYASSSGTSLTSPSWFWSKSNHFGNNHMIVPGFMPSFLPVMFFLPPHSGEMSFKLYP